MEEARTLPTLKFDGVQHSAPGIRPGRSRADHLKPHGPGCIGKPQLLPGRGGGPGRGAQMRHWTGFFPQQSQGSPVETVTFACDLSDP